MTFIWFRELPDAINGRPLTNPIEKLEVRALSRPLRKTSFNLYNVLSWMAGWLEESRTDLML